MVDCPPSLILVGGYVTFVSFGQILFAVTVTILACVFHAVVIPVCFVFTSMLLLFVYCWLGKIERAMKCDNYVLIVISSCMLVY